MAPKVSVVVPNCNYARYLDERIGSLLRQTFTDFELVIVDDASTDESRAVIEKYRADRRVRTLWFDINSGSVYPRWNDGAAVATGEYLMFAGADDSCEPALLSTLVARLDEQPLAGMAYSRSWVIDAAGNRQRLNPSDPRWANDFVSTAEQELPFLLAQKTVPTASAVLLRRSLFEQCGGFDTTFQIAADHMLWARILRTSAVAYSAEPLNLFRSHEGTVRSRIRPEVIVLERYRVLSYILDAFAASNQERHATFERLARHWFESLLAKRSGRRIEINRQIYRAVRPVDPSIDRRLMRLVGAHAVTAGRRAAERCVTFPGRAVRYAWRRRRELPRWLRGHA